MVHFSQYILCGTSARMEKMLDRCHFLIKCSMFLQPIKYAKFRHRNSRRHRRQVYWTIRAILRNHSFWPNSLFSKLILQLICCSGMLAQNISHNSLYSLKGEKKTSLNLRNSFCWISPATSIIDDWDIIHLKSEIHSYVWSTKTFLYGIRELSYIQNNIGYQISRI